MSDKHSGIQATLIRELLVVILFVLWFLASCHLVEMAFFRTIGVREFEMKKYLLLTGMFAVLTFNSAHAQGYYYENDGYYDSRPRYERRTTYRQPQYREVNYNRTGESRYRRMTNADARRYEERQVYRSNEPTINRIRPYIGLDIAATKMKFGKGKPDYALKDEETGEKYFKDKLNSISAVVGAKVNPNFGIEAYYQQSSKGKKTSTWTEHYTPTDYETEVGKSTLSYKSYGVDLIAYLPVVQEFELLAALGLGQYDFEAKYTETDTDYHGGIVSHTETDVDNKDFDSLGIRLGLGAQYNITNHVALRGMVRYVKLDKDDYVKNLVEASLGLRYLF